jgi:hypothetical protein
VAVSGRRRKGCQPMRLSDKPTFLHCFEVPSLARPPHDGYLEADIQQEVFVVPFLNKRDTPWK